MKNIEAQLKCLADVAQCLGPVEEMILPCSMQWPEKIIIPDVAYRKEDIAKMRVENVDNIVDFCVERLRKEGHEVEMTSYETTDGRMKYEIYVSMKELCAKE